MRPSYPTGGGVISQTVSAAGGTITEGDRVSTRIHIHNGSAEITSLGNDIYEITDPSTKQITVTPHAGHYVVAGYFAGTDYADVNPSEYDEYNDMELELVSGPDPETGEVTYQFTTTEFIEADSQYKYIYLYFHCAELPDKVWPYDARGEASAPTDGEEAKPFISDLLLCGDPDVYNGYYALSEEDRDYLTWEVVSIEDLYGNKLGGDVSFDNNHLKYTPTANEAGKTVYLTIRPTYSGTSYVGKELCFNIKVNGTPPSQTDFTVTTNVAGNGSIFTWDYQYKPGDTVMFYVLPDSGNHISSFEIVPNNVTMTGSNAFIMPNEDVELRAVFEPHSVGQDDGDCTTPILCAGCDEVMVEGQPNHNFGGWIDNGNGTHTGTCTNDGCTVTETENCTYSADGKCTVCGNEKPAEEVPEPPAEEEEEETYIPSTPISDGWKYYSSGTMYYSDGKRTRGLAEIDGETYYFDDRGFLQYGWKEIEPDSGNWYHFGEDGAMDFGWYKEGNVWYYLDPETGRMYDNGPATIGKSTYYFYDWGGMASDWWYEAEDGWYFFGGSGAMKSAQWLQWKGHWYYLTESGKMAVGTDIGGYYVDASGVWIP